MSKGKVLVVEDERIISLEIRLILQKLGYEVVGSLQSGDQVLEKVKTLNPDLILMDIMLEGDTDGIQTIEEVRKVSDVPVIYMTAYSDHNTRERANATNPTNFLVKPIPMKILEEIVPAAMHRAN